MATEELKTELYFIDSDGNYNKCHKLLPDIRKILGEIEVLNGELVEITKPREHFEKSLYIGKSVEDVVCEKIRKKYPKAYVIKEYCKEYDIYVPETGIKIEVKQDKKSNYTGNFVIETEFNGKPSALSTTTADFWVLYDGEIYAWITPDRLRQITTGLRLVTFVGRGDDKPKKAYLVKKESVFSFASTLDRVV